MDTIAWHWMVPDLCILTMQTVTRDSELFVKITKLNNKIGKLQIISLSYCIKLYKNKVEYPISFTRIDWIEGILIKKCLSISWEFCMHCHLVQWQKMFRIACIGAIIATLGVFVSDASPLGKKCCIIFIESLFSIDARLLIFSLQNSFCKHRRKMLVHYGFLRMYLGWSEIFLFRTERKSGHHRWS